MADDELLLTAAQVAERLHVRPATVLGWHRLGRIPAHRLSHKVLRFHIGEVVAALEGSRRRPPGVAAP